jgi:hypothetical protein
VCEEVFDGTGLGQTACFQAWADDRLVPDRSNQMSFVSQRKRALWSVQGRIGSGLEPADISDVDDSITTHQFAQLRIQRLLSSPDMNSHVILREP